MLKSNCDYASKQLKKIDNRIIEASRQHSRDASSITLVGAAKYQNAELIAHFGCAGLSHIGENYLVEALDKQRALQDKQFIWHFIGKIQSNKTRQIATHFSWVHSVDRLKIAERMSAQVSQRSSQQQRLQVLIQINIDNEANKAGVDVNGVPTLCARISELDNLQLRGLMLMPRPRVGFDQQRIPYFKAKQLLEQCNQQYGLSMDTLSMGMSNDLEAAIAEGSTMIRVGADLFGVRDLSG